MTDSIDFGSKTIASQLTCSDRKSIGITITPDMEVIVKPPRDVSIDRIKEKLRKRAPWIIKQQGYFLAFHPGTPRLAEMENEAGQIIGLRYPWFMMQNYLTWTSQNQTSADNSRKGNNKNNQPRRGVIFVA